MWNNQVSPQALQKRRLREDAAYIGMVLLAVEGVFLLLGNVLSWLVQVVPMDKTTYLVWYAAVYSAGMLVPAVLVSVVAGRRWFPLSPCRRTNAPDAFWGILVSVGVCMLANIVASFVVALFETVGVERPEMPDFLEPNVTSLLLNLVVFAVLPALLEEAVFRGYVLRALRPHGDWFAVSVSAVLFGWMHGNVEQIPFALVVGFALGWLYIMTDNIWLPVAVHFANNAFSFVLQYFSFGMDETQQGLFYTVSLLLLVVLGLAGLAALLMRRSMLLRRLPRHSALTVGERLGALATSPLFLVCVAVYSIVTVLGS